MKISETEQQIFTKFCSGDSNGCHIVQCKILFKSVQISAFPNVSGAHFLVDTEWYRGVEVNSRPRRTILDIVQL